MKDLLLYVADADTEAFMNSLLENARALEINQISFDIKRHPQRDSGMIQSGAELVRMQKGKYKKALLIWDHHGSGREKRQSPDKVQAEIQKKLDTFTWKDNSFVTIITPELERWLWYCENALLAYLKLSHSKLNGLLDVRSRKLNKHISDLKAEQPKELFEYVMRDCLRRTISPRDFAKLGTYAEVKDLMACESFHAIVHVLRAWFPQ